MMLTANCLDLFLVKKHLGLQNYTNISSNVSAVVAKQSKWQFFENSDSETILHRPRFEFHWGLLTRSLDLLEIKNRCKCNCKALTHWTK